MKEDAEKEKEEIELKRVELVKRISKEEQKILQMKEDTKNEKKVVEMKRLELEKEKETSHTEILHTWFQTIIHTFHFIGGVIEGNPWAQRGPEMATREKKKRLRESRGNR